ncbi:BLUF domain-containing protein [Sphingomonas immobilis]|uniref:BLUF domain-containing protein n=1 Tax=Sphingomonas immobilis TaxID=3063997 RepID=A0ABT9A509_9SPHN|nr:BLUF domain-containing protein [Sphingomonas sp. CA1-15]MDO7844429.1 BLUF domain-containing protein [Sphingomonas sp. CA1-15]
MSLPERSLLYVSHKTIDPGAEEVIQDIVSAASVKNAALGVTGALVATRAHFAQILEGPADAVHDLMDSICRDARHTNVIVLREWAIIGRSFADFSLAYSGPSSYVAKHVVGVSHAVGDDLTIKVDRVIALIAGLAVPADVDA